MGVPAVCEAGLQYKSCLISRSSVASMLYRFATFAGYPDAGVQEQLMGGCNSSGSSGYDVNWHWRLQHMPVTSWGGDLHCPVPLPLFSVSLLVQNGQLAFSPALEELCDGVVHTFDAVIEAGQTVEDVAAKVRCWQLPQLADHEQCSRHVQSLTCLAKPLDRFAHHV